MFTFLPARWLAALPALAAIGSGLAQTGPCADPPRRRRIRGTASLPLGHGGLQAIRRRESPFPGRRPTRPSTSAAAGAPMPRRRGRRPKATVQAPDPHAGHACRWRHHRRTSHEAAPCRSPSIALAAALLAGCASVGIDDALKETNSSASQFTGGQARTQPDAGAARAPARRCPKSCSPSRCRRTTRSAWRSRTAPPSRR